MWTIRGLSYILPIESCKNSYAPYSNFPVGACVRTKNGNLFNGCNVENSSYGMSVCAEVTAITTMVACGERSITDIAIFSSKASECKPCGACRQTISEFASETTKIHLCGTDGNNINTIP